MPVENKDGQSGDVYMFCEDKLISATIDGKTLWNHGEKEE